MTERENFRRLLAGEMPEYIPAYDMPNWRFYPTFDHQRLNRDGSGFDIYGVEYVSSPEADGGAMSKPGVYILDDITKWRDVIKTPDLSGVDWEKVVKKDVEHRDPANNPLFLATHNGYFQLIVKFMGFENGLCALFEEPEEVKELYEYVSKYYLEVQRQYTKYGNLLALNLTDDTATSINPFVSMDMYRELLKPYYKLHTDMALNDGLYVSIHNCGRCEDQIEDWMDLGISGWDPAQTSNDLVGIKAKYGRKLCIIGGWNSTGPATWQGSSDDMLIEALEKMVSELAPGGGWSFSASVMGASFDEGQMHKKKLIREFYETKVRDYYKNH
ncbi:MAG: hypothetical protein IKT47_01245 [Oscillospiraceae bacterium]|nr:hypothetical protein [Oscillospiraceae bacterium]